MIAIFANLVPIAAVAFTAERSVLCKGSQDTPHPLLLQTHIQRLAAQVRGGAAAAPAQAAEMEALVQLLESQPSDDGAAATCGTWDQIYCDNPGAGTTWGNGRTSRRRLIGPITGRVTQVVMPDDSGMPSTYQQRATFGRIMLEARLDASVDVDADEPTTWSVEFQRFSWRLGTLLPMRSRAMPPGRGGTWRNTYVSREWRVMRAGNRQRGDGKESLYVLRRA